MKDHEEEVRLARLEVEQLAAPVEDVWTKMAEALNATSTPDEVRTAMSSVIETLRGLERSMLTSASILLNRAVSDEVEASYRFMMNQQIMTLFRETKLFRLALALSVAPDPGLLLSTQLPNTTATELIAAYSQLCIVIARQRRLVVRIAELEAEVAALKADAGGDAPPVVDF